LSGGEEREGVYVYGEDGEEEKKDGARSVEGRKAEGRKDRVVSLISLLSSTMNSFPPFLPFATSPR